MATTSIGFRWLDILEKEFDKACVELDTSLLDAEPEDPEVVCTARQKISTLSSCFSQLTHKALTIFQHSAKLEAELVDMRAELVQTRAALAQATESPVSSGYSGISEAHRTRAEAAQFAKENAVLRETILALHSELFGARLATKYLDKELAGRIQQLQLLGRDMRADIRDSLWAQVEAEILLQRHKSLVRVCRGAAPSSRAPRPPPAAPRTVTIRRSPHLGLGISVTGGREHGVPILISELEADGPAALTGELCVGDAILAINELDLTQACHKDAVKALQSVKGDCALCVQFIATDDDDKLSEDNYRFPLYPDDEEVFCRELDGRGATPTAPRTPDYSHRPPSDVDSVTDFDPHYPSPSFPPLRHPYPDYNALNNNLNIVDMDDHRIQVETESTTLTEKLYNEVRRHSKSYDSRSVIDHSRTHFDQQRPVIEQQRSVIEHQRPVIEQQRSVIDLQRPVIEQQRSVIEPQRPVIEQQRPIIEQQQSVIDQQRSVIEQQRSVIEQRPVLETQKSINDTQKNTETQKSELQKSKDSENSIVQTQRSVIDSNRFYKDTSRCMIEPRVLNTPYAPIYRFQSSSASPPSTPVHEPRNIKKKKVKSHDWRSKGAYRAIEDDDTSDDTQTSKQKPVNGSVLPVEKEIAQIKQNETQNVPIKQLVSIEKPLDEPARSIPTLPPPNEILPRNSKKITLPNNPIQAKLAKNKGFRIGSAKRISETPLTNGNSQSSNGVKDYQSQIISGDGDPDFGTPV